MNKRPNFQNNLKIPKWLSVKAVSGRQQIFTWLVVAYQINQIPLQAKEKFPYYLNENMFFFHVYHLQ